MPFFDLPLAELEQYRSLTPEPSDFDAFWSTTLDESRSYPLNARFSAVDIGLRLVETYDVEFSGFAGQRIKGWLLLPARTKQPIPGIVEYIGYGGGRGSLTDWLVWPVAGYATLIMDTRGQGSSWRRGDTPDIPNGANPFFPGFMTQGILDPHHYYYRRVFTDAVRAIEALSQHPLVDSQRLAVTGASQGGGITLAAAGLLPSVTLAMPNVPFLCDFRRAIEVAPDAPYTEIVNYLRTHREKVDTVLNTLNYFDGMHFARRIRAEVLCSTALMDTVCPPSTVFAAYNAMTTTKTMKIYTYNDHAGGGSDQIEVELAFLHQRMPVTAIDP